MDNQLISKFNSTILDYSRAKDVADKNHYMKKIQYLMTKLGWGGQTEDLDESDKHFINNFMMNNIPQNTTTKTNTTNSEIKTTSSEIQDLRAAFEPVRLKLIKEKMYDECDTFYKKVDVFKSQSKTTDMLNLLLAVIQDLSNSGINDLILIKHSKALELYETYCGLLNTIGEFDSVCNDKIQKRKAALNKLTNEERELLGIKES